VHGLELLELAFRWEQELLEECSERVYQHERALLPRQREAAEKVIGRRTAAEHGEE